MSQSKRIDSADHPQLEDLYGRIGIAAVAAAARYERKDTKRTRGDAERTDPTLATA